MFLVQTGDTSLIDAEDISELWMDDGSLYFSLTGDERSNYVEEKYECTFLAQISALDRGWHDIQTILKRK